MTVELKEHVERIISDHDAMNLERIRMLEKQVVSLEQLISARLGAQALAVQKQEAAYNARFESVNEWRATFGDVANSAVSQDVFAARMDETGRRLNVVEQKQASQEGRSAGQTAGMGLVVLILSIVAQLLDLGG